MKKRRRKKWLKKNGLYIDPKDTWFLDVTIAKFILQRLKLFKKLNNGYPRIEECSTPEAWDEILDKMIVAFDYLSNDSWEWRSIYDNQKYIEIDNEINEGLQLFAKWYRHLWW